MTPALAALIAAVAALGGWAAGWLTAGAALAAAAIGTCVLSGGGTGGLVLLGTFFVSGSLLSARGRGGSRRGSAQVFANGWAAAVGGLVIPYAPEAGSAILAGGLAAAQADTWATEVGRHSRRPPRLISTGRPVTAGTSGGVTVLGTLGGGAGAVIIALLARAAGLPAPALGIAVAGVAGMLADSVLGATVQARYVCEACGETVETLRHCESATGYVRGVRWMTNDTVNAFGTGIGAVAAALGMLGWSAAA
jgi:uncharacterized protein (TIGR00297 family)